VIPAEIRRQLAKEHGPGLTKEEDYAALYAAVVNSAQAQSIASMSSNTVD
jgi:hypothetical protein